MRKKIFRVSLTRKYDRWRAREIPLAEGLERDAEAVVPEDGFGAESPEAVSGLWGESDIRLPLSRVTLSRSPVDFDY